MITEHLTGVIEAAVAAAVADGVLPKSGDGPVVALERPRRREHGDWSTNIALIAAQGRGNPRGVATALVERLPRSEFVARVDIAGPGFINFHLSPQWLHDVVTRALDPRSGFGRSTENHGTIVNVEFVSSNPTGPINVVSGRHAAVGDALANLLEATGAEVTREFYVNDAGRQAELFARSVAARYLQRYGKDARVPEEGYQGDYIAELAAQVDDLVGDDYVEMEDSERIAAIGAPALELMVGQMRVSLERFGTRHDLWFSERSLHDSGAVHRGIDRLRAADVVEERDGALWFLSTRFGDDRDRVLVKANGEPTYLAGDVAYLLDKFERGFTHLIYVWGADHHGTVARLQGAAEALGFDRNAVEIPLIQIVSLFEGGRAVAGSKRRGVFVALDELVDRVGPDAARYTFLTRSIDAPLDFDIALAQEQAPENPVYYVQYAHARISSILRKADEQKAQPKTTKLDLLVHPSEDELIRKLAAYEETVPEAARMRAPQRITRYVEELASAFSAFYRDCRVVSDEQELTGARLALCAATRRVIGDALGLLGVGAPERM